MGGIVTSRCSDAKTTSSRCSDGKEQPEKEEGKELSPSFLPRYRQLLLELVAVQRRELSQMRHDKIFSDELLRSKEFELDLEEARFRKTGKGKSDSKSNGG